MRGGAFGGGIGYPAVMSFSPELVALLDGSIEVDIETRSAAGTPHRATIWVVVDRTDVFVRSVNGTRGRWYREAIADPAVALHLDGRRLPARATPAADEGSIDRASRGYEQKYRGDPSTPAMLQPEILDTTIRLEPA